MWITFLDKTYPTQPKAGMGMYLCKNLKWFLCKNILLGLHKGREGQFLAKWVLRNLWMTPKLGNEKVFSGFSRKVWIHYLYNSISKFRIMDLSGNQIMRMCPKIQWPFIQTTVWIQDLKFGFQMLSALILPLDLNTEQKLRTSQKSVIWVSIVFYF